MQQNVQNSNKTSQLGGNPRLANMNRSNSQAVRGALGRTGAAADSYSSSTVVTSANPTASGKLLRVPNGATILQNVHTTTVQSQSNSRKGNGIGESYYGPVGTRDNLQTQGQPAVCNQLDSN